ncbi:hypothetical protein PMAC_002582 [Pneumocystis sp. 'macacae']|nr:hypothetical protein PMAC_002582 [Pneumocystis sp. 'macacae']
MRWRGVRDDEASVCTKQLGRVGEVGCEKNVYRADESVHEALVAVSRRRRGVEVGVQIREGGGGKSRGGELKRSIERKELEELEGVDKVDKKIRTAGDKKQRLELEGERRE